MKLSTTLNYSGDVAGVANEVSALEKAGLDCVWVSEGYSVDAATVMGYIAAKTETIEIGSSIINVFSRTATLIAMTFAGLDMLSGGRANCGLGASGPQVIEGFHGVPYEQPMQRIRETIDVCRMTWRRDPVDYRGSSVHIPLAAGRGTGLGKPLKIVNRLPRPSIPIWWAALKGRSVESAAEVADGWIPAFFAPEFAHRVWGESLARGTAKRSTELGPLKIMAGGMTRITESADEVNRILNGGRPLVALYVGGMGARGKNFYNEVFAAYGWEKEAATIQDLYLDGHKEAAARAIPREYLESASLVGPAGQVQERLGLYREAGVTHLQMTLDGTLSEKIATIEQMRALIEH